MHDVCRGIPWWLLFRLDRCQQASERLAARAPSLLINNFLRVSLLDAMISEPDDPQVDRVSRVVLS